jgi:hypothetical protein
VPIETLCHLCGHHPIEQDAWGVLWCESCGSLSAIADQTGDAHRNRQRRKRVAATIRRFAHILRRRTP